MSALDAFIQGVGIGVVGMITGIVLHRALFSFYDWLLDKLEDLDEQEY